MLARAEEIIALDEEDMAEVVAWVKEIVDLDEEEMNKVLARVKEIIELNKTPAQPQDISSTEEENSAPKKTRFVAVVALAETPSPEKNPVDAVKTQPLISVNNLVAELEVLPENLEVSDEELKRYDQLNRAYGNALSWTEQQETELNALFDKILLAMKVEHQRDLGLSSLKQPQEQWAEIDVCK